MDHYPFKGSFCPWGSEGPAQASETKSWASAVLEVQCVLHPHEDLLDVRELLLRVAVHPVSSHNLQDQNNHIILAITDLIVIPIRYVDHTSL